MRKSSRASRRKGLRRQRWQRISAQGLQKKAFSKTYCDKDVGTAVLCTAFDQLVFLMPLHQTFERSKLNSL